MFDNLPMILFSNDCVIAASNDGAVKLLESCQCSRITDLFPDLPQALASFSKSNRSKMCFEQEIDDRRLYFGIELKRLMTDYDAITLGTLASFYELTL
jgi:hypothetical protein